MVPAVQNQLSSIWQQELEYGCYQVLSFFRRRYYEV